MAAAPMVFVSYSHDSEVHKEWVIRFASDLRAAGIDATLDRWDLAAGQDKVTFMVQGIANSDRVVMVCSEPYVQKANHGRGGVRYEGLIITGELVESIDTKKFIPIIRANNSTQKTPKFMGARIFIDFNIDSDYKVKIEELVREIHGRPVIIKPPLGPNPFSGEVPPTESPTRLLGPSGLTTSGEQVLEDQWFKNNYAVADKSLTKIGLKGTMELRFALHDPIGKSQIELLNAVKKSEIRTFGWPIGVTLENRDDCRPRPMADGIVAEIAIGDSIFSERPTYDYWALRTNGDFFLIQSLFEDYRTENKIFFNTRIVRVTESIMFCKNLYSNLGASDNAKLSLRIRHKGLAGRELTSSSPNRFFIPSMSKENISETQIVDSINQLDLRLVDHVRQITEPMFMLFDFKQFVPQIYEDIVRSFVEGRVS